MVVGLTVGICLLALAACDEASEAKSTPDIKSGSDKITSSQGQVDSSIESIEMNVIFKYPDGREDTLGKVLGASACKKMALEHMVSENLIMVTGWNYTCCTIEEGSSCHRKLQ